MDELLAALMDYAEEHGKWVAYMATNPYPYPYARESLDKAEARVMGAINALIDARIAAYLRDKLAAATIDSAIKVR